MATPRRLVNLLVLLSALTFSLPSIAGDDWLPISKEDLAMKDYAPIPGTHAVILYRKVERDDKQGWEKQYYRIKILDEEGKKYANVETDTFQKDFSLGNVQGRTIRPDGSIVPFDGKVFDKVVAKYKSVSLRSKTFALPDVQVGSIIEYKYILHWDTTYVVWGSEWMVQDNLPTRDADFSLKAVGDAQGENGYFKLGWISYFLDAKSQPKEEKGVVRLTVHNVPPFEKEEFIPPEVELRQRVEFTYIDGEMPKTPDDYWKKQTISWTKGAEDFMNKRGAAEKEVAATVSPNDAPEAKLRKIYDHVQKIRNLTFERAKSEKEEKQEKLKDNSNIEDVLKHGYGTHNQLTRVFVAMARAAGFEANLVRIPERDQYFFHQEVFKMNRINWELAMVKIGATDQTLFLDPATLFCPFGMLSWEDTGVTGLLEDKNKASLIKTPQPQASGSVRRRSASLVLDADGTLSGSITAVYEARDALRYRLSARDDDETARKKKVEDLMKEWLPAGATVEISKVDDWNSASDKFVIDAKVTVPNFAAATGKRTMVPISLFPGSDANPLTHAKREYPVYFHSPYYEVDELEIKLPGGMQMESLPQSGDWRTPSDFAEMKLITSNEKEVLKVKREVVMRGYYFGAEHYPALRQFLDKVKATGDEQAVLRAQAK